MAFAPNLGSFPNLAALIAAFPASSVAVGTQAYVPYQVVSNGAAWVAPIDPIAVTYFGAV